MKPHEVLASSIARILPNRLRARPKSKFELPVIVKSVILFTLL